MKRLILMVLLILFPGICRADVLNGLIGWWKLDEGSGTTAKDNCSAAGCTVDNLTINNSPSMGVSGMVGKAYQFTGTSSQDATIGTGIAAMAGATNLSLTGWMKRTAAGNEVGFGEDGGTMNTRVAVTMYFGDGNVYCNFGSAASFGKMSSALNDTQWHFVACTFDGSQAESNRLLLYVDGVSVGGHSGTNPVSLVTPAQAFYIGDTPTDTTFTTGSIDDVRIYNRTLSAAEIKTMYQNALSGFKVGGGLTVKGGLTIKSN